MISDKKRLEIANVCYANVAGEFAAMHNPKYRGSNFTWERFIERCKSNADLWMMIHHVRGNKQEINETAKQYASEIATTLVTRMQE